MHDDVQVPIPILSYIPMAQKVPDVVQKLLQLAKPTFVNNRWRKPAISARKLAGIRKGLVAKGVAWDPKPLRDRGADKPLKLTKWERERGKRQELIAEKMRNMPQMVEEYRKARLELRTKTRKKKERTEEQLYLIATGKAQKEEEPWKIFVDDRKK